MGHSGQSASEIAANIEAVMSVLTTKYLPDGWNSVLSLNVKATNAIALPIYNVLPTVDATSSD